MSLVEVDLASVAELRERWAAAAAVMAVLGNGDMCHAEGRRWHWDDAGGNWCDLFVLGADRAVLQGNDHEYSDTYFRKAAEYFGEEETDLLAGAPAWWGEQLPPDVDGEWVGFVYGYENGAWRRAAYDLSDGFGSVGLPAMSDERLVDLLTQFVEGAEPGAILALAAAGTELTEQQLAAVVSEGDFAKGVAAARAFRG
jgi:hypothetical protein